MALTDTIRSAVKKKLPSVQTDDTLKSAINTMTKAGATALVVMVGKELIGIVTDMDIMRSIANGDDLDATKVLNFMTKCELITGKAAATPCVQLDEDENVLTALKIMDEAGVHHLLVSGADGEAVGMVTSLDLFKQAAK